MTIVKVIINLLAEPCMNPVRSLFSMLSAAYCWDTVSNPGLIALLLVLRDPLRSSVLSINGCSHSKNQFDEKKQG